MVKVDEILTGWLPWITSRAGEERSWLPPSIDEQVVILSPSGELSLGVVLGSIYQQKYPAAESDKMISSLLFQDGTKLSYNKDDHHFEVSVVDKITLKVNQSSLEITRDGIRLNAERIDLN